MISGSTKVEKKGEKEERKDKNRHEAPSRKHFDLV